MAFPKPNGGWGEAAGTAAVIAGLVAAPIGSMYVVGKTGEKIRDHLKEGRTGAHVDKNGDVHMPANPNGTHDVITSEVGPGGVHSSTIHHDVPIEPPGVRENLAGFVAGLSPFAPGNHPPEYAHMHELL